VEASDPFDVLTVDDHPDPSLYDQTLPFVRSKVTGGVEDGASDEDGYGYLETRDGTLLSVNVRLPDQTLYGPGPYPTVVQYSGYAPSRPGAPAGADAAGFLAGVLGFAYVGVNVRGSGCSGGVFDVFNAAQAADGYDVVETVATQPWVKHGHVGMIGVSYSGITQISVAATNPPHLAAITPLSVIEDPWDQQWAGGIYNSGFTQQWLASRDDEASGGAAWVQDRLPTDSTCGSNLEIRSQNVPFEEFARSLEFRPADADQRNMSAKAREIDVPVFLAGAWQDEQTGARFTTMLDDFVSVHTGQKKFTMYNGHHPDPLTPLLLTRWFEFLAFYVDRSVPKVNTLVRAFAAPEFENYFGTPNLTFEPNRFLVFGTDTPIHGDFAGSLAAYEAEQPVRVLFESGASPAYTAYPMAQQQRWAMTFPSWPPPDAAARTFYLGPDGALTDTAPTELGIDRYLPDPDVLDDDYFVSGDHTKLDVVNDWQVTADGKGLAYETAPLTGEMIVAGEGYVDLWFRSDGSDAPIEVVVSEVYEDPDPLDATPPEEVRVQHGLLRAGYRTLDEAQSTDMLKEHLFFEANYEELPDGTFVNVQVPILGVAHPFRPGSRLRIEINTAGGDAALWAFESDDFGATHYDVARGGSMVSKVVLPVLPYSNPFRRIPEAFNEQSERPPCDSLRGQPCRDHKDLVNQTVHQSPACASDRFNDVSDANPFCADITWLSDEGITGGFADGSFGPVAPVTRGSMAAFLYRLAGSPLGPTPVCADAPFSDVGPSHVFCGEIGWLATTGVTGGYEDGTFRPGQPVSRQNMAAFLYRLAGSPLGPTPVCADAPFSDVGPSHVFCGEIGWLVTTGITAGNADGSFGPAAAVSRQSMAAFLQRYQIYDI
jgi:predicted acyl esterase